MNLTRIFIGCSFAVFFTIPYFGLGYLSQELRRFDFFKETHIGTTVELPMLTSLLLPFGPIEWWSYITPCALSIAVAAAFRKPLNSAHLMFLFTAVAIQSLIMIAAARPYFMITGLSGIMMGKPYPISYFAANLSLLAVSIALAMLSVKKSLIYVADPDK